MTSQNTLSLRVLGDFEVWRGNTNLALPQSKKTRALLAYLALTQRAHRRERLCALLWDVTDDPRAALRWSLSKLRPLLDAGDHARVIADRESVAVDLEGADLDLASIRARMKADGEALTMEELLALAARFRGPFLEGLDLPDFTDYQAWCVSMREEARRLHASVLRALLARLSGEPAAAVPHARALVQADPFDEHAHIGLVRVLMAAGQRGEAEQRVQAAERQLQEAHGKPPLLLRAAWRELQEPRNAAAAPPPPPAAERQVADEEAEELGSAKLTGRTAERASLLQALDEAKTRNSGRVVLVGGDPGMGKSRLLRKLVEAATAQGGTVLRASAFEADTSRPYGIWIEALRGLPRASMGESIGRDLAPLIPELGPATQEPYSRERLFGAVAELIAARAHSAPPVVLAFDDAHWCDSASADLLHYVLRLNRHRPVLTAIAYRAGEIDDNAAMAKLLRGLLEEGRTSEIELKALSREDVRQLVGSVAPTVDAERIYAESGGNPLFALELARAAPHLGDDVPRSLTTLVRAQIDRLPGPALEILRWAAVLGRTFEPTLLGKLTDVSPSDLVASLETMERRGFIRAVPSPAGGAAYGFTHSLVQRAIYNGLSEPRQRVLHNKIAQALLDKDGPNELTAGMIAYHAALGGDPALAARACVAAGRRCLRLFANAAATALVRRGRYYADLVAEPDRTKLHLELTQILLGAGKPDRDAAAMQAIEELTERALDYGAVDHARLGFHMLSVMSWETGEWSDAQRLSLQAELVSRSAEPGERVVAMAEAARCLAMLERDLGQADALLREATALSRRTSTDISALHDATGLLHLHKGDFDAAADEFRQARMLARSRGDRLSEFLALAHTVVVEIERERYAAALALCGELVAIGQKVRDGSDSPFSATLEALARYGAGDEAAIAALDDAIEGLRVADAKHRMIYALTRAARIDFARGDLERTRLRAQAALDLARPLDRPSDVAIALALLACAAQRAGDAAALAACRRELDSLPVQTLSARARAGILAAQAAG
jgi:DNA-binding SARP family transcriptional activator